MKAKVEKSPKPKITLVELKKQRSLIIISLILVAYGLVFYYWPLTGWLMAFQNFKPRLGILHSEFIGLAKFKFLFSDRTFLRVIRNTFCMGVINLVTTTFMAIFFALALNELRLRAPKKVIQTISYMPHFLSWIIVTGILHDSLSATGIVNDLLMRLHWIDSPFPFFAKPNMFWGIVTFAQCWKETGFNAIVYLAAITAIDPCLYEAARIDGAGRLQQIKYVTLPSLMPTIVILLIMNIGNVLNVGFEVQYLLGNGLVQRVSQTIDIYVLNWGISQNDFSLGTAAGIFKSAVSIVLILIFNNLAKKVGEESLF